MLIQRHPRRSGDYSPYLDSLRGIAVIMVMASHWLPNKPYLIGVAGVYLFLVISSFLVTSALLRQRADVSKPTSVKLKQFYIRRFTRLTPALYAALLISAFLNVPNVRETLWWHLLFLTNVWGSLNPGPQDFNHLWYSSALEQLYLFWPALVLAVPIRLFIPISLLLIVGALVARGSMVGTMWFYVMPFSFLDALGIGALIAIYESRSRSHLESRYVTSFGVGLILLIPIAALNSVVSIPNALRLVVQGFFLSLFFAWAVLAAFRGVGRTFSKWLGFRPLVYLGIISYSVYIWHMLLADILPRVLHRLGLAMPAGWGWQFVILVSSSVFVGWGSWFVFEKHFNLSVSQLMAAGKTLWHRYRPNIVIHHR